MLLLDTHVILWMYAKPQKISAKAMEAILSGSDMCFSAVSAWEHGIKRAKLGEAYGPKVDVLLNDARIEPVDFPFGCHGDAETLPPIHKDPFDRMLIAHARYLECPLITIDEAIHRYPVETIW